MSQEYYAAYSSHQRQDETIRETEAHALLSCASRLEAARQPDASKEFFADALRHNQQLWTLFQSCICDPTNPLPRDLKTMLLNLSVYVDKVTFRALGDGNTAVLGSLITINRTLAAGLRKTPPKEAQEKLQTTLPPDQAPNMQLMTSA